MKKTICFFSFVIFYQLIYCQQVSDSLRAGNDSISRAKSESGYQQKIRKDTRPLKERLAFGFGSSFWITPAQTYFELAPVLAYRFPKTLITGFGYRYIYRHQRVVGENLNAYGPDIFARINLLKRVYLWTEYEILTNEYETQVIGKEFAKEKTYSDSWFAGIGYIRSLGKKGRNGISVQILYNILYNNDDNNPYYSPLTYRVGYYF